MGRSRYASSRVVDNHYGTWDDPASRQGPGADILDGVLCVDHVLSAGERLDTLAHRYYGDSEFWWVIAMANCIQDPFSLTVGTMLRVPLDARSILDKVQR